MDDPFGNQRKKDDEDDETTNKLQDNRQNRLSFIQYLVFNGF